jgi:DNA-binding PadR family transcriptional regulator
MPTDKLGEFELLVVLSILRQADEPYANRVRDDLEAHSGRSVTRGALYRTLERLSDKGFVAWSLEGEEVPERGGHPRRRLAVTDAGLAAVRRSRDVLRTFLDGLDPILDAPR